MYNHQSGSPHNPPRPGRGWSFGALWRDLKIAWRLIWDPTVPALLKICIPFLAFLYFLWPLDLLPGLFFDDIAIVLLATRLFIRLAPQDRVRKAHPGDAGPSTYYEYRNGHYRNGYYHDEDHHDGDHRNGKSRHEQAGSANFRNGNRQNGNHSDDDHDVIDTTWRVIDDK